MTEIKINKGFVQSRYTSQTKKTLLLLLTITINISCATTYLHYVLGINKNPEKKIYDKDSFHTVTPSIEIYNRANGISHSKYDDREIVKSFVIETLKSELNKEEHYELELMSKDYLTVNRVLEEII